jgi:predicted transposase YbfD/YdcC
MDSTALSDVLGALSSSQRKELLKDASLVNVYQILETLPDPRRRQGLRYELAYLLTCLAAAMLCGRNSTLAVAEWCRDHQDLLEKQFGPRKFYCPDDSLYRKLLPQLNACQVEASIGDWIRATLVAQPDEPIALDGKKVRGAKTDEKDAPDLLSFCTHYSQETLFQVLVGEKTNEIPVAFALLPFLPVAGRVYTADALHTHLPFYQRILELHGHTVLIVKGNQPTLKEHLVTYFADPDASFEQDCTIDLQKGRKEVRSIKVTSALNDYLKPDWPGVAQVAQLTRTVTVTKTGVTTTEVVYLITTLPPSQASPLRLLELVRGHWCIENRSHYVRDVTFQEDRSRLRTGNAPQIMASFRNLVITLIHRHASSQIASTRRSLGSHASAGLRLASPSTNGLALHSLFERRILTHTLQLSSGSYQQETRFFEPL